MIDADELLKELAGYRYDTGTPEARRAAHDTQALFQKIIQRQPTAYDVDKVMEQLEELREEILSDTSYDNDIVNHYLGYVDLMIDTVKSGGIE